MNDDDRWCQNRRGEVAQYLRREQVLHGRISSKPVGHLARQLNYPCMLTAV